ncbi:MAG: DUF2461 domain-containing protein [bacterium]
MSETFAGFPRQCVEFFTALKNNNDKVWFEKHRAEYDHYVMQPARDFVAAMGDRLREIAPRIIADPRVNKSLFKIHRDTRFSPDKTPFKTHMGILFWEGERKRMECSGFYFHLEPPELMLGAGIYLFPRPHLQEFRKSVVHAKHGPALAEAVNHVAQHGEFWLGGKHFKQTPRGFDSDHERAGFLLFNGLTVGTTVNIPSSLYSSEIIDACFEKFEKMAPVHRWLVAMTERV